MKNTEIQLQKYLEENFKEDISKDKTPFENAKEIMEKREIKSFWRRHGTMIIFCLAWVSVFGLITWSNRGAAKDFALLDACRLEQEVKGIDELSGKEAIKYVYTDCDNFSSK